MNHACEHLSARSDSLAGTNKPLNLRLGLALALALIGSDPSALASQAPVDLGAAGRFAVLAASEITSVPTSSIHGDVGLSPAARSRIAGLTPVEVVGSILAADDGGAVAVLLTKAHGDLTAAYNDLAGRSLDAVPVPNADLGGRTLAPGLYKSTGTLAITGNLTLDAQGDPNAIFVFQVASSLNTAPGSQIILSGGANAANIYWQVGTSATLGSTTRFSGIILADQSVSLATGATLHGSALARIAAVTLDSSTVTLATPPTGPSVILFSAAEVVGPYSIAPGHSVHPATKIITVSRVAPMQFYRLQSATALTIRSATLSGPNLVILYE